MVEASLWIVGVRCADIFFRSSAARCALITLQADDGDEMCSGFRSISRSGRRRKWMAHMMKSSTRKKNSFHSTCLGWPRPHTLPNAKCRFAPITKRGPTDHDDVDAVITMPRTD